MSLGPIGVVDYSNLGLQERGDLFGMSPQHHNDVLTLGLQGIDVGVDQEFTIELQ